ncbi:uncharacterized protein LOC6583679 [Drosophila mojavensis]|uniref:Enkurin domain-containing protein n=1 Tax=Drosophila mojavensis TaxID=7230 RepID=B4L1E0_DROMO|nr:uncharacterized protein LOC6583679 [Drosophila mojavensis]EDW06661.2 uncharacterized protein Dmoj_GI15285 [Drosophila mojavensis]
MSWMKRSAAAGQVTQRNFLRENKLLVGQTPLMTLRRLEREKLRHLEHERESHRWPLASYELPTVASLAHRSGTLPLMETQRRLFNGGRGQGRAFGRVGQRSEKEIQTEDISDEQFLSAALLKCTEHAGKEHLQFKQVCSEGDELPVRGAVVDGQRDVSCLRRIASNFELGKVPAQRLQPSMQHRAHQRLLGHGVDTVPAQLEQEECQSAKQDKLDADSSSNSDLPNVLQLAIPDVTDVEQEPQLDQSLSARTQASCRSQKSKCEEPPPATETQQTTQMPQNASHCQGQDQVLLTESQRISLLEAAQSRQKELIWEYNRLPLSMGTLRVRNLKLQLEQQLDLIDSDLKMLNLPQVYIRRDHLQQISSISC